MFQKFFLFAVIFAVVAIVYTNSLPTGDEADDSDQTFCKPFSTCTIGGTECSTNLIYKTCRVNLFGSLQCCL
uniref:Uncharacterized protein n=1 Tax=Daphnia galeata TaxID=27404 RepID=A0A8J2RLT9_9CRUS|nr:unnamed protein product [Daphnia galeata]